MKHVVFLQFQLVSCLKIPTKFLVIFFCHFFECRSCLASLYLKIATYIFQVFIKHFYISQGKFKDGTKNPARVVQIKERDVYITDDIIVILQEHIKSLPEGTKILFPSQVNGYLSDTNLRRRVWQPLLAYVGITDRIRLHDLRGSYADIALEHGASIKFIQNQLGHAKAQTTLDIYMKNNDDTIKNALEQMNGVFTND